MRALDEVYTATLFYGSRRLQVALRLPSGFVYLMAVLDWLSRYVLVWELSVTLDGQFCRDAFEAALATGRPELFNTDQGTQFTTDAFTALLWTDGVQISTDGRRPSLDNIFVERLWPSVR